VIINLKKERPLSCLERIRVRVFVGREIDEVSE
jgi:hypothetical protein